MTRLAILVFAAILLASTPPSGAAAAEGVASQSDADTARLLEGRREANKEWLALIPDYEMRLYARIRATNKKVLRNTRLSAVVIALLVILCFLAYLVLRNLEFERRVVAHRDAGSEGAGDAAAQGPPPLSETYYKVRFLELKVRHARTTTRQRQLGAVLAAIYRFLDSRKAEPGGDPDTAAELDALIDDCRQYLGETGVDAEPPV